MSTPSFKHQSCPVVVLRIEHAQVMGDDLAQELRDEFLAVHESSGAKHVVIDFEQVQYLSSAGLRPLLFLVKRVRERGGRMVLCRLHENVREVLDVTRLIPDGTFEVADTVIDGVAMVCT